MSDNRKYEILQVGTFDENGTPVGWTFDGKQSCFAAINVRRDGSVEYGGWTMDQLRQIASDNTSHGPGD